MTTSRDHLRKMLIATTLLANTIFGFFSAFMQTSPPLVIEHLTGDFYIYTTFSDYNGTKFPANGMYVVTKDGVILIDSPWDTTQFQPLLDSITSRHGKEVKLCVATHFHEDRTAGLEFYSKQGIRTYTTKLTDSLSQDHGMKRAQFLIDNDTLISLGQYTFQTYYPGHGHTKDNIVIWFEDQGILYGGCLIKSYLDQNLGNLADADVNSYAQTVSNVINKCVNPQFVIPGHNAWTKIKSLDHTLFMAEKLKKGEN